MRMCAYSDEEWNTLSHVPIMSDAPWDPRILDHIPPDEWFSDQPQYLELIEKSTYDEHDMYKESLSPCPEDNNEQVLDAEKTDADPNLNQNEKRLANSPIKVSRVDMKVYLHNLVHDEVVPEYRIFRMGRHLHEGDINYWEAHPVASRHSPRDHPSSSEQTAKFGTTEGRRSPRNHPSSSEQAAKRGTKKKHIHRVQPEPAVMLDTLLKTMDGNPLGQSKDVGPDDQDELRMDYNNPSKVNDHKIESRMWVSAPHTKLRKEDTSKYKKFFCGLPRETVGLNGMFSHE
jgi:hypothetical protein